jgi:hypothetical protein
MDTDVSTRVNLLLLPIFYPCSSLCSKDNSQRPWAMRVGGTLRTQDS